MTKKGTFTAGSRDIPGDSWNPAARMSDERLTEKFKANASYILDDASIAGIIDIIARLDEVEDINDLAGLLAP